LIVHLAICSSMSLSLADSSSKPFWSAFHLDLGRCDIGFQLLDHLVLRVFAQPLQLDIAGFQVLASLVDRELISFQLQLRHDPPQSQSDRRIVCQLRSAHILLGDEHFAEDKFALPACRSLRGIRLSRSSRLQTCSSSRSKQLPPCCRRSAGKSAPDPKPSNPTAPARPLLDRRSFRHHLQDRDPAHAARFHLAADFHVAGAFDFPLLGHHVLERGLQDSFG